MKEFIDIHLKQEALDELGLPNIGYPVPSNALSEVLSTGNLPFAGMLYWLQLRSEKNSEHWQDDEPALDRLAQLIAPEDLRPSVTVEGDSWWLEIGPVDLDGTIVTIQRRSELIAAIAKREDGRLRVSTYRPLDAKSAECRRPPQ